MQSILLSSAYLPPIHYFAKLYAHKHVVLEQYDYYLKQTFRNRCIIAAADGELTLTIPVERFSGEKCTMKNIRISEHGRWQHLHWQALISAYRTSPYFEYYCDDFAPFYVKKWPFLYDFNEALIHKLCELIDLSIDIEPTNQYQSPKSVDPKLDYREKIHPKQHHTDDTFQIIPYYQVFSARNGFLPNLSVIDLLFNMGPESLLVLRDSVKS